MYVYVKINNWEILELHLYDVKMQAILPKLTNKKKNTLKEMSEFLKIYVLSKFLGKRYEK